MGIAFGRGRLRPNSLLRDLLHFGITGVVEGPPIQSTAMSADEVPTDILRPQERLVMIVGNYGSGKTEIAVNLAVRLADEGRKVQIADLDLVNPYFRSREAQALMQSHGIRVVVPPGSQVFADLPIVLPEIRGMLQPPEGTTTIIDVGGDDVGAKALASFRPTIGDDPYELWQVVNAMRPFTQDVEGCLRMKGEIESASRLEVTGFLANAHLIDDTTPETVLRGWELARDVAEATGRPVRAVALMDALADDASLAPISAPLLRMERRMLPPWLHADAAADDSPMPAARPIPLGKPGPNPMGNWNQSPQEGRP